MNFTIDELRRITAVLQADTNSFAELARIAGLRPNRDFRGADLSGVNFNTDDLTGFDFTDSNLNGANFETARGLNRAIFVNIKTDKSTRGLDKINPKSNPETLPLRERPIAPKMLEESIMTDTSQQSLQMEERPEQHISVTADYLRPKRRRMRRTRHLEPAVTIEKSVTNNYIICLEDGVNVKNLKSYLRSKYHMTPRQYREKWRLPKDYPMIPRNRGLPLTHTRK